MTRRTSRLFAESLIALVLLVKRSAANQGISHIASWTGRKVDAAIQGYHTVRLVSVGVHDPIYSSLLRDVSGVDEPGGSRGFHKLSGFRRRLRVSCKHDKSATRKAV